MPQEIQVGQDILEFPDNMPDEEIRAAIDREYAGQNQNSKQEESSLLGKAGQFAMGLPQALGNKAVGGVQAATSALGFGDSEFAKNLASEVSKLKEQQAQLSGAERAGIFTGEVAADLALTKGRSLLAGGAVSGLTTPLEDSSSEARAKEIAKDAALSYTTGKGVELIGKGIGATKTGLGNIIKGVNARAPEELGVIAQGLKDKAKASYDAAAELGGSLKPKASKKILGEVRQAVSQDGPLFKTNHGKTLSILQDIENDALDKGYKLGIDNIDQYRKAISDAIFDETDKITGIVSPAGRKLTLAASKLENILDNIPENYLVKAGDKKAAELFKQGNKDYGVYRRFQRVADIVEKSQGDPNLIKRNLANFVKDKKNLKGFSGEQKDVLKSASKLSGGEGILKMFGKFGLDLGTPVTQGNTALPVLGALGAGFGAGAQTGGATLAAGTVARQAQKYIARGKLDDALKLIQSSGDPAKTIAKISNRKLQEKLIKQLIVSGGAATAEAF
jgi:hypothetical protein